jgi:DNA-directed RNA polymerase specialized sigma24 family protein
MQAIDSLPEDQREALYLKCVREYSYGEVAVMQQCSVGTLKSRLWRARNALQKLLEERASAAHLPPGRRPRLAELQIFMAGGP